MLIPFNKLSEEQQEIIHRISKNKNSDLLVEGPAGSGKTLISLHTLRSAAEETLIKPLILIYNHSLYGFLNAAIESMGISDNITIATKDRFFTELGKTHSIYLNAGKDYGEKYLQLISSLSSISLSKDYDLTIIDEVQDFSPEEWALIKKISKNIISLGDFKQSLYKTGLTKTEVLGNGMNEELTKIFRYHKNIAKLAQPFTEIDLEAKVVRVETTQPQLIDIDADKEFTEIEKILNSLSNHQTRTAIISPDRANLSSLHRYLNSINIENVYFAKNKDFRDHDFNQNTPILITSHSSKGLEFENVILFKFDIHSRAIAEARIKKNLENILYVNITRTNTNLFIIRTPYTIKELKNLEVIKKEDKNINWF